MRVREGDVFLIPIALERVAFGQVAYKFERGRGACFVVVYDGIYPRESVPDLAEALSKPRPRSMVHRLRNPASTGDR
jgi:hypothetical protein